MSVSAAVFEQPHNCSDEANRNMITWSYEIPFKQRAVQEQVPDSPGVYQILQSESYPRYKGQTHILKIGMSKTSLRKEILNHFIKHTAANRLATLQMSPGITLSVKLASLPNTLASEKGAE